jgi:hypothetical protein
MMTGNKKRVVLAFNGLPVASDILRVTCLFARETSAELQLLRVHPPRDLMTERIHGEQLYSELKTVHAQLQREGICAQVRAEYGHGDEPLLNYLMGNPAELVIFVGKRGRDGELDDEGKALVHTLLRSRECRAMMVA